MDSCSAARGVRIDQGVLPGAIRTEWLMQRLMSAEGWRMHHAAALLQLMLDLVDHRAHAPPGAQDSLSEMATAVDVARSGHSHLMVRLQIVQHLEAADPAPTRQGSARLCRRLALAIDSAEASALAGPGPTLAAAISVGHALWDAAHCRNPFQSYRSSQAQLSVHAVAAQALRAFLDAFEILRETQLVDRSLTADVLRACAMEMPPPRRLQPMTRGERERLLQPMLVRLTVALPAMLLRSRAAAVRQFPAGPPPGTGALVRAVERVFLKCLAAVALLCHQLEVAILDSTIEAGRIKLAKIALEKARNTALECDLALEPIQTEAHGSGHPVIVRLLAELLEDIFDAIEVPLQLLNALAAAPMTPPAPPKARASSPSLAHALGRAAPGPTPPLARAASPRDHQAPEAGTGPGRIKVKTRPPTTDEAQAADAPIDLDAVRGGAPLPEDEADRKRLQIEASRTIASSRSLGPDFLGDGAWFADLFDIAWGARLRPGDRLVAARAYLQWEGRNDRGPLRGVLTKEGQRIWKIPVHADALRVFIANNGTQARLLAVTQAWHDKNQYVSELHKLGYL